MRLEQLRFNRRHGRLLLATSAVAISSSRSKDDPGLEPHGNLANVGLDPGRFGRVWCGWRSRNVPIGDPDQAPWQATNYQTQTQ